MGAFYIRENITRQTGVPLQARTNTQVIILTYFMGHLHYENANIARVGIFTSYFLYFCSSGRPRVLTNMSSGDIKAKEGDLVNLLCSAQGEPPITLSWEKDQKPLESFVEKEKPHRSSFLVVKVKDETSFGKYVCHIEDRFQSTTHTISIQKLEDTISVQEETGIMMQSINLFWKLIL